jgi:hypothetical protein
MTILPFFVVGGTVAEVPERARRRIKAAVLLLVIFIVFVKNNLVVKIVLLWLHD